MARVAKKRVVIILLRPLGKSNIIRMMNGVNENRYGETGFLEILGLTFSSYKRIEVPVRNHTTVPEEIFDCAL
jgi:hypothetical protein